MSIAFEQQRYLNRTTNMDVDENTGQGPPPSSQQTSDIEQMLLHQFSRMGTTDHDELVNQLQKVLGNQLNYTTARFFLDMNNWNLQAAVGCYLDYYSGTKLPSMQIISDVTVGEGEAITPNTRFIQSWNVKNTGDEAWPYGCYLKSTSCDSLPITPVNSIEPGDSIVISVTLTSPKEHGSYQTKWRLFTSNGSCFGDTIWAIVQVTETGTLALTQQLAQLKTNTSTELALIPKQPIEHGPPQIDDTDMC